MYKILALSFTMLFFQSLFAQNANGYWDNIRTTSETITLKAGEKRIVKTADLPQGTTEVVIRITVLDDNKKMASSLVSLLKAIPDPTGISQGSAGAIYLLSTVSGDDKCKYAVFASNDLAESYLKNEKTKNACWTQETPINKEAKVLSVANSKCLNNTDNLWFGFESDNWMMSQKVLLEVVPWIDIKLSRGWNTTTKNQLLENCMDLKITKAITKKDLFCGCFLETIIQKYTHKEYSQLLAVERSKENESVTEQCLLKIGEKEILLNTTRSSAIQFYKKGIYESAIHLLEEEIFNKGYAKTQDYNTLGHYYLVSKQFSKAEKIIKEGIKLDNSEVSYWLTLSHVYLLNDDVSNAKSLHEKYKLQNVSAVKSWKQQTIEDLKLFETLGFPTKDFKKILKIFK